MGTSTIFRGTVIESALVPNVQTVKQPNGTEAQVYGNGTFKVRLAVAETFSGEPKAEQIVYTSQQGSACGFPFQVGREYVVFTYLNNSQLWTSHCSRTTLLEPGVENASITWMRAYKSAPHGSEISGSLLLPRDSTVNTVSAVIQLSGPDARSMSTERDGRYSFRSLRPGEYVVAATLPDGFASRPPAKITVADKSCEEVDWPVTIEGNIAGNVVDADGKPVSDLPLELMHTGPEKTFPVQTTSTDLSGNYRFEHLSPGDYLVAARNPGSLTEDGASTIYFHHPPETTPRAISLGLAANVDEIDFVLARLRPTPSIRVNVVFQDGSPAPAGLYLWAFPNGVQHGMPTRTGVTDSAGMAVMPLKYGQEYAISVALDSHHQSCGNSTITLTEDTKAATIAITRPDLCTR
jgi:hypothetical protein